MKRFHSFLAVLLLALASLGAQAQAQAQGTDDDDLAVDPPASVQGRPGRTERGAHAGGAATLREARQAARDGDLPRARRIVDEMLQKQPDNARAQFVKAQLASRDRDLATARAALQEAERLAPGLPFAREKAVANLRTRLERLEARGGRGERPRGDRNAREAGQAPAPAQVPAPADSPAAATETPAGGNPVETRTAGVETRNMGSGAQAERETQAKGAFASQPLLVGVLIGAVVAIAAMVLLRRRRSAGLTAPAAGAPGGNRTHI